MVSKSGFERIGKGVNWDYHTDFGLRTSYNSDDAVGAL